MGNKKRRMTDKLCTNVYDERGHQMRREKFMEFQEEGHHHGGRQRGRDGSQLRRPKTFRRGRAIAF